MIVRIVPLQGNGPIFYPPGIKPGCARVWRALQIASQSLPQLKMRMFLAQLKWKSDILLNHTRNLHAVPGSQIIDLLMIKHIFVKIRQCYKNYQRHIRCWKYISVPVEHTSLQVSVLFLTYSIPAGICQFTDDGFLKGSIWHLCFNNCTDLQCGRWRLRLTSKDWIKAFLKTIKHFSIL